MGVACCIATYAMASPCSYCKKHLMRTRKSYNGAIYVCEYGILHLDRLRSLLGHCFVKVPCSHRLGSQMLTFSEVPKGIKMLNSLHVSRNTAPNSWRHLSLSAKDPAFNFFWHARPRAKTPELCMLLGCTKRCKNEPVIRILNSSSCY